MGGSSKEHNVSPLSLKDIYAVNVPILLKNPKGKAIALVFCSKMTKFEID